LAVPASWQFDDVRFMCEELLQSQLDCPGVPAEQLAGASRQKMLADFSLFEAELKSEQLAWSNAHNDKFDQSGVPFKSQQSS